MVNFDFKSIESLDDYDQLVELFFPEVLILKQYHEKNEWHDESVYLHTFKVFKNTKDLLKEERFKELNPDLMLCLAICHDLGKAECFKTDPRGLSSCVNHEVYSTIKLPPRLEEVLGSSLFKKLVRLIRCHSDLHLILDNENRKSLLSCYKRVNKEIFLELTAFTLADILDGHLMITDREAYDFRLRALMNQ